MLIGKCRGVRIKLLPNSTATLRLLLLLTFHCYEAVWYTIDITMDNSTHTIVTKFDTIFLLCQLICGLFLSHSKLSF